MSSKKSVSSDQSGAVSFLSVLIFIIIITTVALAYMQSVTRQQRNAFNYDMSTRAYYAAESGVQDAVRALRADRAQLADGKKDSCDPLVDGRLNPASSSGGTLGGEQGYQLSYTCQLIDTSTATGRVSPGQNSVTMRIVPVSGPLPASPIIRVSWGVPAEVGAEQQTTYYSRANANKIFGPVVNWNRGWELDGEETARPFYPVLRAAVVSHPGSGFQRTDIRQRVAFLNPAAPTGTFFPHPAVNANLTAPVATQQASLITNANCSDESAAGSLSCYADIQVSNMGGSSPQLYLNLSSLYRDAYFEVSLRSGSTVIPLANTTATIDVTGKAGSSIFRRVKQTVPLGENYRVTPGVGAALTVGEGICKAFSITNSDTGFNSSCTP